MVLQSGRPRCRPAVGRLSRQLFCLTLLLCLVPSAWAATTVVVGTNPTTTVIKGTLVTPEQVIDGELVIEGDTITCVAATCAAPDGATRITVTNAYIFPGFVDAHNHVAYNVLPRWTPPKLDSSGRLLFPGKFYGSHGDNGRRNLRAVSSIRPESEAARQRAPEPADATE